MADPGLEELQAELGSIRAALADGQDHLGMRGETLQHYFLLMQDKENLLISRQLQSAAEPPPPGRPKDLDRNNLGDVIRHMTEYEGVKEECLKALRALSSLSYASATEVGNAENVFEQLLRILTLHPGEANIQAFVMRIFCNVAYDPLTAANKLATNPILTILLSAASSEAGESGIKAGEALARIMASETDPKVVECKAHSRPSPISNLFASASSGETAWHVSVLKLIAELVENEVVPISTISDRLADQVDINNPTTALGWLSMAKILAGSKDLYQHLADVKDRVPDLPNHLISSGTIRACMSLMQKYGDVDDIVQLRGVETLSALVGDRKEGLVAFVDAGGVQRIQEGAAKHIDNETLQTKSIRAMASGVGWERDVQRKAGYNPNRGLELTLSAMSRHSASEELQKAGLDALQRYISVASLKDEAVQREAGSIVKEVLTVHQKNPKILDAGRLLLKGLDMDENWTPVATVVNGKDADHSASVQ